MARPTKEKKPTRDYSVYLRDRGPTNQKLGLVAAPEPLDALTWAIKRHRAFLRKLECGRYKIVVTDLLTDRQDQWPLDQLIRPPTHREAAKETA